MALVVPADPAVKADKVAQAAVALVAPVAGAADSVDPAVVDSVDLVADVVALVVPADVALAGPMHAVLVPRAARQHSATVAVAAVMGITVVHPTPCATLLSMQRPTL